MTPQLPVGLRVVRAAPTAAIWGALVGRLVDETGSHPGPGGHQSFAWLTHRLQRDRLWAAAARRGLKGWLQPPHAFFSEFPKAFGILGRRLGHLERTILLDRLVTEAAAETGFAATGLAGSFDRPGIGRAVDAFLADLLPEGVDPDQLEATLATLPATDAFAEARNRWLVTLYRRFLAALAERNAWDPRAIHSLVADRIAAGGLPAAIHGARKLHIYGLTSIRHRRKLLRALAAQDQVEVVLYLLDEAVGEEFAGLTDVVETIPDPVPAQPAVQPAPDQEREIEFVAHAIKKLVAQGGVPLDEIAVVARTGREDARFAHETLERAGIPTTARIRTPLAQVPALAAVLQLLRAAALGWRYRPLRHVLENSYFKLDVDLRPVDHLAGRRRVQGLDGWQKQLAGLEAQVARGDDDDKDLKAFRTDRLGRTVEAFGAFAGRAAALEADRPLAEWIAATRGLLDPGWFDFRKRVCRPDGGRYDLVRLDQQGIEAASGLLHQWEGSAGDEAPITALQWYHRLRRLLAATEVTLSTPRRTGVQVVEAHEAALVPFRHTFLIHANEGEFPRPQAPGWLFNEDERRRLASQGLPVAHRDGTLRRERLLWDSVTRGPAVTITYRTADPGGTPLLPSLLVPDHDPATEIPRTQFVWDEPFTPHLAERAEVERVKETIERDGTGAPVIVAAPDTVRLAIVRAVAESHRLGHAALGRRAGALGPWTGHLRDPAVLAVLADKFGPDRIWSASQLETWGQNPFVFLVQRVLYLEEKLEVEDDANVMVQGSVTHSILEEFFRTLDGNIPDDSAALRVLDQVAARVFSQYEADSGNWLGVPSLWRIRKEELRGKVQEYLAWELAKGLKGWTPREFEFAFGGEGEPAASLTGPNLFGESATMRMRGKIDRIDHLTDKKGQRQRVIDYKSGGTPSPSGYLDGGVLQGPLYLAVLDGMGRTLESAEYRSIKEPKSAAKVKWESDPCVSALRIALTIPALVRAGRFEPQGVKSTKWKSYWPGGLALYRAEEVLDVSRFE
ncbi:MAG: PD-(D/E)XK nuclease family protein [Gemmatimonadales bacterium]